MNAICIILFIVVIDIVYTICGKLEKIHCDLNNLISHSEDTKEIIDELKDIISLLNRKGIY